MPVVPSSTLTPGLALAVLLVTGAQTLGSAPRRGLIVGMKTSTGSATANQVYQAVAGADAVAALAGVGSQAHLCATAAFAEWQSATIDLICVAEPGGGTAATQTLVYDDTTPVTVAQTIDLWIAGRHLQYVWLPGVAEGDVATAIAALINAGVPGAPALPVTAAAASDTVTLTARNKGPYGNDIKVRGTLTGGTGGSQVVTGAALTGGATEPTYTTALTNMLGTEYDTIAYCTSNADCAAASSSSTPSLVNAKIATRNTGFNALLQQSVFAHTGAISAAKAGIAQQNIGYCEVITARNAESLPCEWQGAELGARLREESIDPNVNRTNRLSMPYRATLYPSPNLTTDKYTPAELEDLLQSGASAIIYTSNGTPLVSIPRTTYFKDSFSNLDHRLVGVNHTTTYYAVGKGIRSFLPTRFDGMRIQPDAPQTANELPLGVVDESTIRAALLSYLDNPIKLGWLRRDKLQVAVDDGRFSVKVDPNNENRVIILLPISAVPGLWGYDVTIEGGS